MATPHKDCQLDLRTVQEMLRTALEEAEQLDGVRVQMGGTNDSETREYNQRLLALADGLQLASSMVRAEYWVGRGRAL